MTSEEVDDTDSRFNYKDDAWSSGGESGDYDGTSHSTDTAGAQVVFGPFTGTSVTVFSSFDTSQPKVHFFVDDGDQNTVVSAEATQATQFQVPVYAATSLDPSATHTLQINVLDAGPFTLDYVLIGNGASSATSSSILNVGPTVPSSSTTTSSSLSPVLTSPSSFSGQTFTGSVGDPTSATSSNNMSTSSTPGPDATIIGAVVGSVVFIAVVIISLFVFLRKRRRSSPASSAHAIPSSKRKLEWSDPLPPYRPSLHLSIPNTLSLPRGMQKTTTLLPTYDKSASSTSRHSLLHSSETGSSSGRPKPAFLEDDPSQDESPIFDIKKRPVSGSTMTTRVTVGTSVGQRASVPESAYHHYQYSEQPAPVPVPPLPVLPPLAFLQRSKSGRMSNDERSSTEDTHSQTTHEASLSALQYNSSDTNSRSATLPTSLYPSEQVATATESASGTGTGSGLPFGLGTTGSGTGFSVPRRLPLTPIQLQRQDSYGFGEDEKRDMRLREDSALRSGHQPRSPFESEMIVHRDGGVQLDHTSPQPTPARRELPPPYANYRL